MYLKHHNGPLSIESFYVPFGGMLDPDNLWVLRSSLIPWEELAETYAAHFSPTTGAPAKSVKNWGTLTIDASCTPADMTFPTDLKLLNEVRESIEPRLDDLCKQLSDLRKHKTR